MADTIPHTTEWKPEEMAELRAVAARNERSVGAQIRVYVREGLKREAAVESSTDGK